MICGSAYRFLSLLLPSFLDRHTRSKILPYFFQGKQALRPTYIRHLSYVVLNFGSFIASFSKKSSCAKYECSINGMEAIVVKC